MSRKIIFRISLAIILIYVGIALAASLLAPSGPYVITGRPLQPPDSQHILGTNEVGQDIFAQLVFGARIALLFGFCSAFFAVTISTGIGIVIGYYGGIVDEISCRLIDVIMPVPMFVLLIVLAAFFTLGTTMGIITISILMGLLGSAYGIRIMRSQVLSVVRTSYVEGAKAIGASDFRIMSRHILPNIMPLVTVRFVSASQRMLVMGVGLSFLGLWDTSIVDWGTMIQNAYSQGGMALGMWWWILPPGLAVVGISLALALIGYSLEEIFNPRVRVNRI